MESMDISWNHAEFEVYFPDVGAVVAGHGGGRKLSWLDGINTTIYYNKVPIVTNAVTFNSSIPTVSVTH